MKSYECIIWDWNGTLLNDAYFSFIQICKALKKYGLEVPTFEYFRDYFLFPVKEFLIPLGLEKSGYSLQEIVEEYLILYERDVHSSCELHCGVISAISAIKACNISQYILSARDHELLGTDLKHYEIASYFDGFSGGKLKASHHGKHSHSLDLIKKIAIDRSQILFVGDTAHDAEIAVNLGVECILLTTGYNSIKKLSTCGVRSILDNHTQLLVELGLSATV